MVNIEIIIGLIFIAVLGAVFIPLAFDPPRPATGITLVQINTTDLALISQFDNFEWARAGDFLTFGTNNPKFAIDTFSEYKVEVLKYKATGQQGGNEFAHWTSAIPVAFNATSAVIDVDLYWYKDVEGNEGEVCWGIAFLGVGNQTDLDTAFGLQKVTCSGIPLDADKLDIINFKFNATEHLLAGKEWTSIQATREINEESGGLNKDAHLLGLRIIWESLEG